MAEPPSGRYQLFDIEATDPVLGLTVSPTDTGAAVLVRRRGIPVGFWMQPVAGPDDLSATAVAKRIAGHAGEKIAAEEHREGMGPRPRAVPLPLVTIAICTRDRPDGVERLLQSLSGQAASLPEGSAGLEIIVVDNAPSDERTRELTARWPSVYYVREAQPGLDFARNRALLDARGELLAFLDDDVVVDRHWAAGLADAWADNRDAACFTGLVLPLELETDAQILFETRGGFRRGFDRIRYGQVLPGNRLYPGGAGIFGTGANMTFRTDVVRKLGGFDEALDTGAALPGGGDLDMFYRIIRAGHALVYEPRFLVFHQHRRDMAALRRQYTRSWGYGFMCFVTKCLRTDRERRRSLLRLIAWWFVTHSTDVIRQWRNGRAGIPHVPPAILIGEIWGAAVGLMGGYGRSQRRTDAIRQRFAASAAAGRHSQGPIATVKE
jgi:glycosyltransferase involved in cell wall biosynthesis